MNSVCVCVCASIMTHFVLAILALHAAGLGGGVRQTAAGRQRVPIPVPLLVAEPGEGHAGGGDGGHGVSWGHVAP